MPEGQLEEGSLLNERYRIKRVIGQGGMGTVYQAEHERLSSIVAVKEIRCAPADAGAPQGTMQQYEQEARMLVRLNHPNLPKVTDAFVDGDRFYLVMDFVEGATLDACLRMRRGVPIDAATVVNLAIEMADVLNYLHAQNPPIIFRDLKPSNVMVQPDKHIKLIDFGIARRFQPGASKDTSLLGSVGYSPPEQFGKHQTDKRSDIYALGATLHHLLTARDPSVAPFKFEPVEQVVPGVPNSLSRLIANCVAMDPDLRPPDAGVVSGELYAIRDVLNHVGAPQVQSQVQTDAQVSARMSTVGTRNSPWMPGAQRVYTGNSGSGHTTTISPLLRVAVLVLITVVCASAAVTVNNGQRPVKPKKHLTRGGSHSSNYSSRRSRGYSTYEGSNSRYSAASSAEGVGGSEQDEKGSDESSQLSGEGDAPGGEKTAQCSAEILGTSPDGKSLRLHITGEINGRKDTSGTVAVYFYNNNKSPLRSRDPKGANATPSGQLFGQFTFQIDEDSKSIDGLIDMPVDQFSTTSNLLFKCVIYADNQNAGQTELMPFSSDIGASSDSSSS